MRVFLSWSGNRSRGVAEALRSWLPDVVQSVDPWMSDQEISAGMRWSGELDKVLEEGSFGVLCLTPENVNAPWLLFEAGSLAKSVQESRVVPYRLGLAAAEVKPPLSQFQGVDANQEGTLKLVRSINQAQSAQLLEDQLERIFLRSWPALAPTIDKLSSQETEREVESRSEMDYLIEILEGIRKLTSPRQESRRGRDIDEIASDLREQLEFAEEGLRKIEEYEARGGQGATEHFWPHVVERAEKKRARLRAAVRALEGETDA